jgi:hypothetical protein
MADHKSLRAIGFMFGSITAFVTFVAVITVNASMGAL